ncbi:MAG: FG-GAP repeat domain-containing protein, partial [Polyangiaceae bacterium]
SSGEERCSGATRETCDAYANCGDNGVFCDSVWSGDACAGVTSTCIEQTKSNGGIAASCVPPGTIMTCGATPLPSSPAGNVLAGDADGDGNVDVIVVGSDKVQAFLRANDGSFSAGPTSAISWDGLEAMATGDFDGDGVLDIAALTYDTSSEDENAQISFAKGTGGGAFSMPVPFGSLNANATYGQLFAADLDGDGSSDLIIGANLLLAHDAGSTSRSIPWSSECADTTATGIGDFDGDGHVDVIGALGGNVCIAFGDGNGSFAAGTQVLSGSYVLTRASDFDGDSHLDILAVDTSGCLVVLLGRGDRTFAPPVPSSGSIALGLGEIFPIDMDFDGRADLLFANGITLGIALSTGGGAFGAPTYFAPKVSNPGVADLVAALVTKNPPRVDAIIASADQIESIAGACR